MWYSPAMDGLMKREYPWQRVPTRVFQGVLIVTFAPIAVICGGIYLILLTIRLAWEEPVPRPNETPCGKRCFHAKYRSIWSDWVCGVNQEHKCDHARKAFQLASDPHNCTMFEPVREVDHGRRN